MEKSRGRVVKEPEGRGEEDNRKEGEGSSQNMYKGPMDKHNGGGELNVGDRGGQGWGRVMGGNGDNCN